MKKYIKHNLDKKIVKSTHKINYHMHNTNHIMFHIWEIAFVIILWLFGLLFASSSHLPNNNSFSYPLRQVSTLECRTLYWNDMPDSCKINLPIIHWANYSAYENNDLYRSIYTTLWAAPYSESWDQKAWAHAGVDIATARGTPLYSIGEGEVYSAWWNSAYGNLVRIKYVYNWEIVYAIYWHMDSISVKAWDKVIKWQKVWTVWNSWNTSWWLWWYHVHFEIDKDSFWRPAYSYTNCPDLSKWHYKIIQNWLCRTELFNYQYDPIRIFESNSTYSFPEVDAVVSDSNSLIDIEVNAWANIGIVTDKNNVYQWMKDTIVSNDSQVDKWNDLINNQTNNQDNSQNNNHSSSNDNISNETKPSVVVPDQNNNPLEVDVEKPLIQEEKDPLLIELDFSWLKHLAEHFSRLWGVEIRSELKERTLMLWETAVVDIEIFKKWKDKERDWNYYNWVLQVPFVFLSNNDVIKTDINSLQLITKWKAKIKITWDKVWRSTLIIKLDNKKIWYLDITVK